MVSEFDDQTRDPAFSVNWVVDSKDICLKLSELHALYGKAAPAFSDKHVQSLEQMVKCMRHHVIHGWFATCQGVLDNSDKFNVLKEDPLKETWVVICNLVGMLVDFGKQPALKQVQAISATFPLLETVAAASIVSFEDAVKLKERIASLDMGEELLSILQQDRFDYVKKFSTSEATVAASNKGIKAFSDETAVACSTFKAAAVAGKLGEPIAMLKADIDLSVLKVYMDMDTEAAALQLLKMAKQLGDTQLEHQINFLHVVGSVLRFAARGVEILFKLGAAKDCDSSFTKDR